MSGHPQRVAWLIFGIAAIIALSFNMTQSQPAAPTDLAGDFAELQDSIDGRIGVAMLPVGGAGEPVVLGTWKTGAAWSTIKVPLVTAALRESGRVTDDMTAAIARSDNQAAEAIWEALGAPIVAAHKVETVLRESGDDTVVQWQQERPPYSAFGQTTWSLADQSIFLSHAACDPRDEPVLVLMGNVVQDQRWGIGVIDGTRFKGGWGPSVTGQYLVRQFGLITTPRGASAVAIAAEPTSGSYNDGLADMTKMGRWLQAHIAKLPSGRCPVV